MKQKACKNAPNLQKWQKKEKKRHFFCKIIGYLQNLL